MAVAAQYPQPARNADHPYLFYELYGNLDEVVNIDRVLNNVVPVLAKSESSINKELADLANIEPGQLDQTRLMAAQMNMSRWQLAAQLLTNMASIVFAALKNTTQNIRP